VLPAEVLCSQYRAFQTMKLPNANNRCLSLEQIRGGLLRIGIWMSVPCRAENVKFAGNACDTLQAHFDASVVIEQSHELVFLAAGGNKWKSASEETKDFGVAQVDERGNFLRNVEMTSATISDNMGRKQRRLQKLGSTTSPQQQLPSLWPFPPPFSPSRKSKQSTYPLANRRTPVDTWIHRHVFDREIAGRFRLGLDRLSLPRP